MSGERRFFSATGWSLSYPPEVPMPACDGEKRQLHTPKAQLQGPGIVQGHAAALIGEERLGGMWGEGCGMLRAGCRQEGRQRAKRMAGRTRERHSVCTSGPPTKRSRCHQTWEGRKLAGLGGERGPLGRQEAAEAGQREGYSLGGKGKQKVGYSGRAEGGTGWSGSCGHPRSGPPRGSGGDIEHQPCTPGGCPHHLLPSAGLSTCRSLLPMRL